MIFLAWSTVTFLGTIPFKGCSFRSIEPVTPLAPLVIPLYEEPSVLWALFSTLAQSSNTDKIRTGRDWFRELQQSPSSTFWQGAQTWLYVEEVYDLFVERDAGGNKRESLLKIKNNRIKKKSSVER